MQSQRTRTSRWNPNQIRRRLVVDESGRGGTIKSLTKDDGTRWHPHSEKTKPARTYKTKHGTPATMKTGNIGKTSSRPAPPASATSPVAAYVPPVSYVPADDNALADDDEPTLVWETLPADELAAWRELAKVALQNESLIFRPNAMADALVERLKLLLSN